MVYSLSLLFPHKGWQWRLSCPRLLSKLTWRPVCCCLAFFARTAYTDPHSNLTPISLQSHSNLTPISLQSHSPCRADVAAFVFDASSIESFGAAINLMVQVRVGGWEVCGTS